MKKFTLSAAVIVLFILYAVHERMEAKKVVVPTTATTQTSQQSSSNSPQISQPYKDGTYTGTSADAFYGNIQVKATVASGKISDVVFLQYPNDRDESRQINESAMPYLKQEAIAAQSAAVDIVSGATDSSKAFQESLASALTQAK